MGHFGESKGLGEDCEGLAEVCEGFGEGFGSIGESGLGDEWLKHGKVVDVTKECSIPYEDTAVTSLPRDALVKMVFTFDPCELGNKKK